MSTPNILLILADELRADALGCFGNTIVKTPNLDKLAKRGPMYVRTLTTKDWKLTYYLNQPLGELYDRKNDPDEMVNLWNSSK